MTIVYPALFTKTKDHFLIEIPDLNILTQSPEGDFGNAINVARDAIGLRCICLEDGKEKIPKPSLSLDTSQGEFSQCSKTTRLSYVDVDLIEYRRKLAGINIAEKELRNNLRGFLNSTIEFQRILHIKCKKGNVVILSEQDYNGLLEVAYFRTLPPG